MNRYLNGLWVFSLTLSTRKWLPGKHNESIEIVLPDNIPCGKYKIKMGMYNELIPVIYFCTDAPRSGSFYSLGELEVY